MEGKIEMKKHISYLSYISLSDSFLVLQDEIVDMEGKIEMKKRLVEERTPVFEELERVFEERTNEYNALKKNIASMWNHGHFLTDLLFINRFKYPSQDVST